MKQSPSKLCFILSNLFTENNGSRKETKALSISFYNRFKRLYTVIELLSWEKDKRMLSTVSSRKCLACDKNLQGRADKKFCNDYCRNAYNNQLKASGSTTVRNINNILLKNRRILEHVVGQEEMGKVNKEKLLQQGFRFNHLTHTYTNKKGNVYSFCYEYGYLPLEHDWFLVVRRKEEK